MWSRSSALQQTVGDSHFTKAGLSAWLPIRSFDIIFKASHLLHHRNIMSSEDIQVKLHELQVQLNDLQQAVSNTTCPYDKREQACSKGLKTPGGSNVATRREITSVLTPGSSYLRTSLTDEGFHMRELYFLAISLLLAKVACPTITAETPIIISISKVALLHLRHVRSDLPCLLWAITVLSVAATSTEDRSVIVAHLEAMRHFAGQRAIASVLSLLYSAWGQRVACCSTSAVDVDSGDEFGISSRQSKQLFTSVEGSLSWGSSLGLDILFEESLLERVIL